MNAEELRLLVGLRIAARAVLASGVRPLGVHGVDVRFLENRLDPSGQGLSVRESLIWKQYCFHDFAGMHGFKCVVPLSQRRNATELRTEI